MSFVPYRQSDEWPPVIAARLRLSDLLCTRSVEIWGKIDTGAFMTAVPRRVLEALGASRSFRRVRCKGYDGASAEWPVYLVDLQVVDLRWPPEVETRFETIEVMGVGPAAPQAGDAEVASGATDAHVLLGRDVLAAWRLHLDGPQSRYSVE